jgi:hypothetical protein
MRLGEHDNLHADGNGKWRDRNCFRHPKRFFNSSNLPERMDVRGRMDGIKRKRIKRDLLARRLQKIHDYE